MAEEEAGTEGAGEDVEGSKSKKGLLSVVKKAFEKFRDSLDENAVVAAALNATFWGLGYYYNGRRKLFGLLLMVVEIIILVWLYLNPSLLLWRTLLDPIVIISAIIFFFALAYDAYNEAKEEREREEYI